MQFLCSNIRDTEMYRRAHVKKLSSLGSLFICQSTVLTNEDERSWLQEHSFRNHQVKEKLACNVCDK